MIHQFSSKKNLKIPKVDKYHLWKRIFHSNIFEDRLILNYVKNKELLFDITSEERNKILQ